MGTRCRQRVLAVPGVGLVLWWLLRAASPRMQLNCLGWTLWWRHRLDPHPPLEARGQEQGQEQGQGQGPTASCRPDQNRGHNGCVARC
jgi:hypothetical protein